MQRRDISKALFLSAAGSTLVSQQAQAQTCTPACYPRTASEIAGTVTPTNYEYPPGNVKRYGAVGDGIANDRVAIQNALNVNEETFLPSGTYKVNSGLTMRSRTRIIGANKGNAQLKAGASGMTVLSISGAHNSIEIRDLEIYGNGLATVGFSSVSPSQGASSGLLLDNLSVSSCTDKNIYIKHMTYGVVRNVYSAGYTGTTNYGLYLDASFNIDVQNGLLYDCVVAGLAFYNCSHVYAVCTTVFTNPTISAPRLCLIDRSVACGLIRCTFEAQGAGMVLAELELDSSAAPNTVSAFVEDCSFIGTAATKSRCVRIGVNGTVYKSTFRGCRFFKPQSAESVWAALQQHSLFDDCQDITVYTQTAFTHVTVLNSSPYPIHVLQPRS
jgi:hypothetical protein